MNKKVFLKIMVSFFAIFLFIGVQNVNAEFKSTAKKSNNVTFSWDSVENALIYKIDFGKSSETLNESTDYIDSLNYTVYDLIPGTQYYFSLVGYNENAEEIYKSKQISVTTSVINSSNSLSLEDVKMIGFDKIELSFSNEISDISVEQGEFRIENLKDNNDFLDVKEIEVLKTNKKNIVLTLDKEPIIGVEYKIIVLNIRDIYDQNIEFGVDSEATFLGVEIGETMLELNSAGVELNINDINEENKLIAGNLAGVDLNSAGIDPSVLTESTDASKLPQTGPESILILLLAIIFSGIFFAYRFKKV